MAFERKQTPEAPKQTEAPVQTEATKQEDTQDTPPNPSDAIEATKEETMVKTYEAPAPTVQGNLTHKSILNAQIVKTLLNSSTVQPASITEVTCQEMYNSRELSREYTSFISACSKLLPNFQVESFQDKHYLINNETFSIERVQENVLKVIEFGSTPVYSDGGRQLNDIEIEFIQTSSEGAIRVIKEIDSHGRITRFELVR